MYQNLGEGLAFPFHLLTSSLGTSVFSSTLQPAPHLLSLMCLARAALPGRLAGVSDESDDTPTL
jgi:hypothetical protein